jgi:hypothetical protein
LGNHEYCCDCEESDFHHGRPCDPAKVGARVERERVAAERKKHAQGRMETRLRAADIGYEMDKYGNALIRWVDF